MPVSMGFILGWAEDKSSAILKLDLQTLQVSELLTEKQEIHKFMVCDTHLFYGTFSGNVHIFRIPNLDKVGLISYNNEILDIVYTENTTSNMITFKNVLVLEACKKEIKDDRSKGSFSIFRIE
jgi:hypothetical protein